jgi:protein arginine N-methyltransferase 2
MLAHRILWLLTAQEADALFYDVYTELAEMHLAKIGVHVDWSDVDVSEDGDRWGQSKEYFKLPVYRLPVGRLSVTDSA